MTIYEQGYQCRKFWKQLTEILGEKYFTVESCNQDESAYLLAANTDLAELSYYGKPARSFRISDHWNWYSNLRKNPNEAYVQCESLDMPVARERLAPGKASRPRMGWQVCAFGDDGKYHCIFGNAYDRNKKVWKFVVSDPAEIAASYFK